jgi:hypothetical protein
LLSTTKIPDYYILSKHKGPLGNSNNDKLSGFSFCFIYLRLGAEEAQKLQKTEIKNKNPTTTRNFPKALTRLCSIQH